MILKRTLPAPILACLACAALLGGGGPARAQTAPPLAAPAQAAGQDEPATFAADEMTHDKELGVITARGHVEVNHGGRTLMADTISYDQTHDIIRASGNVTLHHVTGDVMFADMMEISGDLKNGVIEDFRAVMADRSRFAASSARLENDETLTMERGAYSPCQPCQDDPTRPLLWQVKAVRVIHDRVGKTVEYQDAWLELAGVPVFYTPYMSHPDPTVKRKSGFLPPSFGGSNTLGASLRTPYFYVIDDYSDVTVTPLFTTQENAGLGVNYRERFTKGEVDATTSVAYDGGQNLLGHIDAKTRFDIDRTWRWGADAQRATTDTYMRRYGYPSSNNLTSRGFVEGFRGRNYAAANVMLFQDLTASGNSDNTPLVMPLVDYNYQGEADRYGAYNTMDINLVSLSRSTGASDDRISVHSAWNLPYIAPKGDIYKLSASMGLDFFHSKNLTAPAVRGGAYNGAALRATPELALDWRWPLARRSGTVNEVFEPIAQAIVSPYGGNSWKMANEDSQEIDLNDTNLFSANRFTGFDRVESGPRTNYGFKWGVYGDGGGSTSVLVGQSYRVHTDDTFAIGSGLENNFSDYVGRVQVSPGEYLKLLYRTRLDKDTLDFRRNEFGTLGKLGWFNYSLNHVFFDRQNGSEFSGRKEVSYSFGAKLTDVWSTQFSGLRDLSQNGGQRSMQLGVVYEDECLRFDTNMSRSFYLDRELKPNDTILFRLVFKTLGEVTSDIVPQ